MNIKKIEEKVAEIRLAKEKAPKMREAYGMFREGLFEIMKFAKKNNDPKLEAYVKKALETVGSDINSHMGTMYEW